MKFAVVVGAGLAAIAALTGNADAYSAVSTSRCSSYASSSFGGRVLSVVPRTCSTVTPRRGVMEMKKGKPNVPPAMRAQYQRQQEMASMREEMMAAQTPQKGSGAPVFNLYVRAKDNTAWYPCGSFQGDEGSTALAKSYRDGGLLAGTSKTQLDKGIGGSLFKQKGQLAKAVVANYPFFKKIKSEEFVFGYKLEFEGLSEEQASLLTEVEVAEQKGFMDQVKSFFGQ